jgi:hypothetical protein
MLVGGLGRTSSVRTVDNAGGDGLRPASLAFRRGRARCCCGGDACGRGGGGERQQQRRDEACGDGVPNRPTVSSRLLLAMLMIFTTPFVGSRHRQRKLFHRSCLDIEV